ncbi:hypothetical protein H8K00_00590 [Clostridium perfringens]|uniref:hypothetical protein n=1 Tax=Clostridium perfringens TaxID=1502 RepID=UPI0018E4B601|nr:hypothetical protein [Clostridium perfringens]MBI6080896.1 hypothetical protein [Clostridium perfringens]MDK0699490.1 hypothetical protein [Clostridium perfringens]MDK0871509.1 hypothetical protein [Clostridium perfringens]MDK0875357.1 hypothetical protein [Clostridium perfringens]MDM0880906.1 hypothetical protein [Clostridium perfringens]
MEYIQLIAIIFCIYIVISILEQITLIEDFYSLLKTGSEIKQDDLREFMQETKARFKKENMGYLIELHFINIICIVITIFIIVFGDIRSCFIPILIGIGLLGFIVILVLGTKLKLQNMDMEL